MLLDLGLAEFSAGQPGWDDHLREAVKAASDDTTRIEAALLFANVLRWHDRTAEAIEVCDGVAARLDGRNPEGRLTLEAIARLKPGLSIAAAQGQPEDAAVFASETLKHDPFNATARQILANCSAPQASDLVAHR